ncbi:unnamed protein product [Ectocarpus sp. 13 AM-2016]
MASQAKKRTKLSSSAGLTTLLRAGFDPSDVATLSPRTKVTYKSPVTLKNVFDRPTESQVKIFYHSRNHSGVPFDRLSDAEKLTWTESLHDNSCLMGYLVYSQLLPCAAENRVKLKSGSAHWNELNVSTDRARLEQRRAAYDRLRRNGSTFSAFYGLPYSVDMTKNVLEYMNIDFEQSDLRHRFFLGREFAMTSSEHGKINASSVYTSCSKALSLMYFTVVILGRPCCLESVILPLSVTERSILEQTWGCPGTHLDGPINKFQTNWREVFRAIGTPHRNINYVCLERATEECYIGGKHVADCFALYNATRSAPGDAKTIAGLANHYRLNSKIGVESGAVVFVLDVLREKPMEAVGKIDGSVLGAITSTYGKRVSLDVQARCLGLQAGEHSLFDSSVSNKLGEIINHADMTLWKARKRLKVELKVNDSLDPADMNKKISEGKMLDPCDPASSEKMHAMLQSISRQVWRPLKTLIGEALGVSMDHPSAFLRISDEEAHQLYEHATRKGIVYTDVANLNTLLVLSNSFQRSQVLREATLNEFGLVPDGTFYRQTFKDRAFKTAGASSGSPPVSHFNLSPGQSMMVHFIAVVGHRFCNANMEDDKRKLLLNSKGQGYVQNDIKSPFKKIGAHWLGLPNFCVHTCRTFWATAALNSGQVDPSNIEDFGSFLQVSSSTLRSSYMSAAGNSAAHTLGHEVLGSVVTSATSGEATEQGDAPQGPKLRRMRMEFVGEIRASLLKHSGNAKLLFRDLVKKRKVGQLGEGEKWFRRENTFWKDDGERVFLRFVGGVCV